MAASGEMDEVEKLRHELFRIDSARRVQNLMGAFNVNHIPKHISRHLDLFALDLPDVSMEVADRGVYVGREALSTLFGEQFRMELKGNMLLHYLATPMIEVAGDGKTAKGVWYSPGIEAVTMAGEDKPVPLWSFGAYAADFIYQNDEWKIWHLHWFRLIKCRYADGWVDDLSMTFTGKLPNGPPLEPTTHHNPYTPDTVQDGVPPCPLPYQTWEEDGWMVREQAISGA